jgi:uncharacterized protein (DUF1697 family)
MGAELRRQHGLNGDVRVVGLLRGVNLGKRQLKMAELRRIVESLGHTDVETYLQSGNVVFTPGGRKPKGGFGPAITAALADAVGMKVPVLTRTGAEMAKVVAACPYEVDDPTKLVVTFLDSTADATALRGFDASPFAPEALAIKGTEVYLNLPFGQARSKMVVALGKVKIPGHTAMTTRNWRTVQALTDMSR